MNENRMGCRLECAAYDGQRFMSTYRAQPSVSSEFGRRSVEWVALYWTFSVKIHLEATEWA